MDDLKLTVTSVKYVWETLCDLIKNNPNRVYRISIKEWREKRSLSQNDLFHKWMRELSKFLISGGRKDSDFDFCKDLMKHTFLGYELKVMTNALTGEKREVETLRRTRDLDVGDMTYFMNQVYAWCVDKGLLLTIPIESEYKKLMDRQSE